MLSQRRVNANGNYRCVGKAAVHPYEENGDANSANSAEETPRGLRIAMEKCTHELPHNEYRSE